ncbi:TPA: hypothetical protein ACTCYE_000769 [Neisseria meningitidis]
MDYRARRRKPFHYPLPLSPPDCQNPQADSECPGGHYRHSENGITLYDFIFFDGKPADEARFAAVLTETCRRAVKKICETK